MHNEDTRMAMSQVRQILFNELGLSREAVRIMIYDEVVKIVEKQFSNGNFERFFREQIDAALQKGHWTNPRMRDVISSAVGLAVKESIIKNLKISTTAELTHLDAETIDLEVPNG